MKTYSQLKESYLIKNNCSEADFLRHLVRWMNDVDENKLQELTVRQLERKFLKYLRNRNLL